MPGFNIDVMKKRMEKYQSMSQNNGDRKKIFWKPQFGENTIRIIPYKYNVDLPVMKVWTYWNFAGHKMLVSPMTVGQPDPIVEYIQETKKNSMDEDFKKVISQIYPKGRWYSPIVVRGEEDQGMKFWQYSKTVYEQIEAMVLNPHYGDIADPKNGMDLILTYSKPEKGKSKYPSSQLMAVPQKSPLVEDKELLNSLLNDQTDLNTLLKPKSYDELQEILKGYLNEVEKKKSETKKSGKSKDSGKKVSDAADEFDTLFDGESSEE